MLPFSYSPLDVEYIFFGQEKKNFYSFCLHIYALRLFDAVKVDTNPKLPIFNLDSFTNLMTKAFPERL
jgi:hypothetical protein